MNTKNKKNHKTISIILPTLNEETGVGKVIDEIPMTQLEMMGYSAEVVVVDGNSSDQTREIAEKKGARVIVEKRKGKGRAVRTALENVSSDFIFVLDADYTYPPTYIPEMLDILRRDNPVVIGSRLKGRYEKGALRRQNVIGNHLLTYLANLLFRTRISDVCTGFWGLRGDVTDCLELSTDGFQFEAELYAELAKKGYSIAEVPILYRRRKGKAKLSSFRDGVKIGWMLIKKRLPQRAKRQ